MTYVVETKKIEQIRDQLNAALEALRVKINGQLEDARKGLAEAQAVQSQAPSDESGVDDEKARVGNLRLAQESFSRGRLQDAARTIQAHRTDGAILQMEAELVALATVTWPQPEPVAIVESIA